MSDDLHARRFFFNIEVLGMGQCNLRCPSCPTGNYREIQNPMGLMKPEVMQQIMSKAVSECTVTGVGLYNWAEPLIHPQIGRLVTIVQSHNVPCNLSSNLNDIRNLEGALRANPAELRVSVSGFTQEVYGVTHRGGDIDVVKANMTKLAELRRQTGATTMIEVLYHRYKGNLDEEVLMKSFVTGLGFVFRPAWAFFMPLEKALAYIDNDPELATLTAEDHASIARLALPLREVIAVLAPYRNSPCILQQGQVTLDFKGATMLCCAVYDSEKYGIGSYLDTPLAQLQTRKEKNALCSRCMKNGLYLYGDYSRAELQTLALKTIMHHYASYLNATPAVGQPDTLRMQVS
jgi:hypothetical protein